MIPAKIGHYCIPFIMTHLYDIDLFQFLKPQQDSFGRFVKIFLDLKKVDHTIRTHH